MLRRWTVLLILASPCGPAVLPARASNCAGMSTGFTALTDLGPGLYHGFQGGLYAGGSNHRPAPHDAAGIAIAGSLSPLDTLGHAAPGSGSIVLVSIGMSNCTQEFSAFVPKAAADPLRNPQVRAIDCALGGQSADRIKSLSAAYWDTVRTRLRGHGSAPLQAQVVWIKEANASPHGGFPESADSLLWNLGTLVRNIHAVLPNVKLAYLTSRIYAGYATSSLNPEPYAYESGFAVKWLIDAQINGADSLNFDPDSGAVQAPWLSWGPYLWADGLAGRADSLKWYCSDFVTTDGTHPSASGRNEVADSLLAFFHTDATTAPWYRVSSAGADAALAAYLDLAVSPNPASGAVEIAFSPRSGERWQLEVLDVAGRRVAEVGRGVGEGTREVRRWSPASPTRAGVYWVRLSGDSGARVRRMVVLASR